MSRRPFFYLRKTGKFKKPIIEQFRGKWLKEMGDGVLASFNSVSDAVYCAKAIQIACQKQKDLNLRIGIHQGEVVEIELYWLKVEPEFASLHDDPRWQKMLDRIGFP